MMNTPTFPTHWHAAAAEAIGAFFAAEAAVDTVLVVNSCARGKATPESDLDFCILLAPGVTAADTAELEARWRAFAAGAPAVAAFQQSGPFARVHLDLITGQYAPGEIEPGGLIDYFEVEIGNHVRYSAPLGAAGAHYRALRERWLPYYAEPLRAQRLAEVIAACRYDLAHIPVYARRGLVFYAFDRLWAALHLYLQALFIAHRTYPLAYNKWIKEQVAEMLGQPELYAQLPPLLALRELDGEALNEKAEALGALVEQLPG